MSSLPVFPRGLAVDLRAADQPRLAELCRECTDFFELVERQPGGAATAAEILDPLPTHIATGTKRVIGVERGRRLVGVVEVLEGFPGPNEWQIGLLLMSPHVRGAGLGTETWLGVRSWVSQQGGKLVRLVVQKQNPAARGFWEKHGFSVQRETVLTVGQLSSSVWVMLLHLAEAAQQGEAGQPSVAATSAPSSAV
jgi:ribosomal protein S18 acetylase RimI-like enzyme